MPASPDTAPGPPGLRRATAADLPAIKAPASSSWRRLTARDSRRYSRAYRLSGISSSQV